MPPQRPSLLSAFFGKLTRNLSLDRWRHNRAAIDIRIEVEMALEELEDCLPAPGRPEEPLEERETAALISRFLREQPALDRNLFLRRYWYLDSIAALADRFQISQGQVKSRLHRTRLRLKDVLLREGGGGMTSEELLQVIGLVDDGLIQEAQAYLPPRPRLPSPLWEGPGRRSGGRLSGGCDPLPPPPPPPLSSSGSTADSTTAGAPSQPGEGNGSAQEEESSVSDSGSSGASSSGAAQDILHTPEGAYILTGETVSTLPPEQPAAGGAVFPGGGQPNSAVHRPTGVRRLHAVGGAGRHPLRPAARRRGYALAQPQA